jgi:hypothetical protein
MKVKKRQYRSKRGRPLKRSKAKSKAKKGSKRRVKKMRGGEVIKYNRIDFIWKYDAWTRENHVATFFGNLTKKIGVIILNDEYGDLKKYIITNSGVDSNDELFRAMSGNKERELTNYTNALKKYVRGKKRFLRVDISKTRLETLETNLEEYSSEHFFNQTITIDVSTLTRSKELTRENGFKIDDDTNINWSTIQNMLGSQYIN